MHLFKHGTEQDSILISCSKTNTPWLFEVKSQEKGGFQHFLTGQSNLFCLLCGEKLFFTEEVKNNEYIIASPLVSAQKSRDILNTVVEKIGEELANSSSFLHSLALRIANTAGGYSENGKVPQNETSAILYSYVCNRASIAIIDLSIINHTKEYADFFKGLTQKMDIHPTTLPLTEINSHSIQNFYEQNKQGLELIPKSHALQAGVVPLYNSAASLLIGIENHKKVPEISRHVLSSTLTLHYDDNPLKRCASSIIVSRLIEAIKLLL